MMAHRISARGSDGSQDVLDTLDPTLLAEVGA